MKTKQGSQWKWQKTSSKVLHLGVNMCRGGAARGTTLSSSIIYVGGLITRRSLVMLSLYYREMVVFSLRSPVLETSFMWILKFKLLASISYSMKKKNTSESTQLGGMWAVRETQVVSRSQLFSESIVSHHQLFYSEHVIIFLVFSLSHFSGSQREGLPMCL